MFHHLARSEKEKMLAEIRRVLKPGGRLELLDFQGPDVNSGGVVMRVLHSHRLLQDNAMHRIVALLADAGLADARRVGDRALLLGRAAYYQAIRPLQ